MTAKKKTEDLMPLEVAEEMMGKDLTAGFEDVPPEDVKDGHVIVTDTPEAFIPPFDYKALTFGERLAKIREDKGYIQKMTREGMGYAAVLYEDLVEQVRPLFLRYGVSWHTHRCSVVGEQHFTTEFAGLLVSSTMMMFTIRFQNVEGPTEDDNIVDSAWVRDVVVPATAFDAFDPGAAEPRGDTGAATATTTAQKYAIRQILNLAAGEDPDFTPMISLSTRAQEERKVLISRLKAAIKIQGLDVNSNIEKIIEHTNAKYQRGITSVEDVETGILRGWVIRAEDKAAAKEATNGNAGSGPDGDPRLEAEHDRRATGAKGSTGTGPAKADQVS